MTAELFKPAAPDWPALVPLNAPNLPELDLAHLPSWAGDYARALAADTETPPELAAGMILATCATAAARRLRVMVKLGYFEPCNLWVVVALTPGNRKSAVQSAATMPLVAWERDQAVIMEPEIKRITSERKTLEARANKKRNNAANEKDDNKAKDLAREAAALEAELPEIPFQPQIWTSDATPERLGALLAEQGECMAWLSSEGGVFDLLQGRYSNGIPNLDLVLKAHSGDPERVDRGIPSGGLPPQPPPQHWFESAAGCVARTRLEARIPRPWSAGPHSLLAPPLTARISHPANRRCARGGARYLCRGRARNAGVEAGDR